MKKHNIENGLVGMIEAEDLKCAVLIDTILNELFTTTVGSQMDVYSNLSVTCKRI